MLSFLHLFVYVCSMEQNHTGFPEETFISNSSIISCAGNTTITIIDLNVKQYPTTCSEYKRCNLTEQEANAIKKHCNKKPSCTISRIIPKSCLFNNYGHVSISYSCTRTVNVSCTFENDQCGWSISSNGTYQWIRGRGKSPENSTEKDRNTTASGDGYYMYTMFETGSQPNDETHLLSGLIKPNPKQCLTYWYHMYGEHINTLKVFQLNDSYSIELWNQSDNQGNTWYFQSVSLNNRGPYRIKFQAIRGNGSKSEIAIDDISILNTDCKKVSSLDCNFEKDTCKWIVEEESEYMWKVITGGTHQNKTRPVVDHSYGFYDENYLYLNASNVEAGQKSNFTSVNVSSESDACFTFWFYMYGNENGTLNVYLVSENLTEKLWSRSGNQPDLWQLAFVDISILDPYKITLEGVRGSLNRSDIAVDGISLLSGSCNKRAFTLDCNFEADKCNWRASSETSYIWTSKTSVDPILDHTIGTVDGHYIHLEGENLPTGSNSELTSTIINPDGDICFTFWYYYNRPNNGPLRVDTESGNTTHFHWSQFENFQSTWTYANFTISKSEPYRIIFKGFHGTGYLSHVALDDISLHERSCSDLITTSMHMECHNIDEPISLKECSKYYLQFNDTSIVFDTEVDNCSAVYQDVQTSITTSCNDMNNSDICTHDLLEQIKEDHSHRCFLSNWLSVEYRCEVEVPSTSKSSSEVEDTTTVALDFTSRDDSSAETTVPLLLTSEALSQVVETTVPVLSTSDAVSQGLIVGLVIGSFVLVFIVAVICLIRRFLMEKYNLEKIENIQGNDYTGHQTIALQQSSIPPHYEVVPNTNNQYAFTNIAMTNSYEIINNEKFDDERKQIAPLENETGSKNESKVNQYDVIDPTVITRSCRSTEDKSVDTENHTVFDQNETKLDRSKISDKPESYDITKTINVVEPHACAGFHSRDDETVVTKSKAGNKHIVPLEDESKEKFETKDNQYEEIDPTVITSVCLSTEVKPRETENNTVFDQKGTEFDPSKLSDKTQPCDLTRIINAEQDNLIMSKVGPNICAGGQLRDDKTVVTETDDESKHSAPPEDDTTKGKFEIKGNQYEEIDNIANISVWHSTEDKSSVINNYTVLDPTETGFDRSNIITNKQSYELAKPVRAENDEYVMSKEGTYDCAGRSNHKELENMYNHAIDNVYDSGSHERKDFGNENAYDHFVRQKDGR